MFQQHTPRLSTSRAHSQSHHTGLQKVKVSSGFENGSALKKNEEMNKQIESYRSREENYKKIIFAKNQEIAMMKSHIHQLEESKIKNYQDLKSNESMQWQIQQLTEQVQLLLESYNQRVQEIENLKNGQDHTELERQVIQLLRENSLLINSLTMTHTIKEPLKKDSQQSISKIYTNESQWKQRFAKLNKEYYNVSEKLAMALAELDNYKLKSRSLSIESIEAFLRY